MVRWRRRQWSLPTVRPAASLPRRRATPAAYEKGFPITMTAESAAHAYVAGARLQEGQLVTSGGRVLGVTAVADILPEAVKEAYRLMDGVQFENRFFRRDIGAKALAALEGRS